MRQALNATATEDPEFFAEITDVTVSQDIEDSATYPEDDLTAELESELTNEADDTCLSVEEVIGRTHGHVSSTEPSAATLDVEESRESEDALPEVSTLDAHLGRSKRIRRATTHFTDAKWSGH